MQAHIVVTTSGDELSSLAARATGESHHPVWDGTVSAAAGVVAGTDTALGILSMGILNRFAKDVGVPIDLDAAVSNGFTGQITRLTSER